MRINDFTNRLKDKYRGFSQWDLVDLERWLIGNLLSEVQIDKLYDEIIYTYPNKTFPTLAFILEAWGRVRPTTYAGDNDYFKKREMVLESWKTWSVKQILKQLIQIRQKINNGNSDFTDKSFYYTYDDLLIECNIMKENNQDGEAIKSHLEYVKSHVDSGKKFVSIAERFGRVSLNKLYGKIEENFPTSRKSGK